MKKIFLAITLVSLFSLGAQADSQCMKDFKKLRIINGVKAGVLSPAGEFGSLFGSAYISFCYEYCGWTGLHATLGAAGNVLLNTVAPLAVLGGIVAMQTYQTVRYVQSAHAHKLLKDAFGEGNGRRLKKVTRKVAKTCPNMTEELVAQKIRELDETKELCNGSLVHGLRRPKNDKQKERLKRKVAFENDIIAAVEDSCSSDIIQDRRVVMNGNNEEVITTNVRFKKGALASTRNNLRGEKIQVELSNFENGNLLLVGEIAQGQKDANGLVDLKAPLKLKRDFEYKMGNVKVTLNKGGSVNVEVQENNFKAATLDVEIEAKVKLNGKALKLKGEVKGKINPDYQVDFEGTIKVEASFEYAHSNGVKTKLKKGTLLEIKVENGKVKYIRNEKLKLYLDLQDDDDENK